jgi:hypothetical protein
MDCAICSKKLASTFLGKILGTYVIKKAKKHAICFECQKKFPEKALVLQQIK